MSAVVVEPWARETAPRFERLMRLAGARPDTVVCAAGRGNVELMIKLCREGYSRVECLRQATCTCADEGADVLIIPGATASESLITGGDRAVRLDQALLCWNDSPQARRAAVDALPLLRRVIRTLVLLVSQDGGAAQVAQRAREVERGFRERGVNASAIVRTFGDGDLGEVVRDVAQGEGADLVVAGAYGRGPIWRTLTGSHTEALLTALDRPLFLSR